MDYFHLEMCPENYSPHYNFELNMDVLIYVPYLEHIQRGLFFVFTPFLYFSYEIEIDVLVY